jgi:hypothetical protein
MRRAWTQPDWNTWLVTLFRPLVIGVMFGCVAVSLVELVRLLFPDWNAAFLVAGCVLAAVEANYSYRLIRARKLRGVDWLRFRLVELALFFPVLKIASYAGDPWASVKADIAAWPQQPGRFFDVETLAALALAVIAWRMSTLTVQDFERIDEPHDYYHGYVPPAESLIQRFFRGGVVLLIATGLTRIGIAQLLSLRRPPVPGLILNVLIYFLLGLVMLAQIRFVSLRKRWQAQEIAVAGEIPGRWVRYSLAFIGLVALLAFLLPTGYTLGLMETVGWAVGMLARAISFLALLIFWLFTLPLSWLMSLLGGPPLSLMPRQPLQQLPRVDRAGGPAPSWFQVAKSLVFWAVILGMIFYVVHSYVRDRPELVAGLRKLSWVQGLARVWAALRRWLGRWRRTLAERLPQGWSLRARRRPAGARGSLGLRRLGGLSPRAQVLYYYLSVLRRADERGIPRRPAQTPDEYRARLGPSLPQAEEEVNQLTDAFVEARYSRHTVEREQARRVRESWQRVKAALRALKLLGEPEAAAAPKAGETGGTD